MKNRKNVIWIVADQMRGQAMGCAGDPNVRTPNLDNLADTGIYFSQAVSGTPLCVPFRGAMITGRYPHHNSVPGHDYPLDPEQKTIADAFNSEGYQTTYIGKWHLNGPENPDIKSPLNVTDKERRGRFNKWIGYGCNNSQWDCHVHGHDGDKELEMKYLSGFETDVLTNIVIEEIKAQGKVKKQKKDKPLFLVLSVQPPHDPYVAPAEFRKNYRATDITLRPNVPTFNAKTEMESRQNLAGYYAGIENLDYNVGRIMDALKSNDIRFDTHVMFFSDHGDMLGSHGMCHKTNPFEESIRIPLIISGETPMAYDGRGCARVSSLVNHVDIAATTLGLCEISVPEEMEGYDYSHYRIPYKGEPKIQEPQAAYLQNVVPTGHKHSIDKAYRGIVTKDGWKYVCFEGIEWLLFDLNSDPYEQSNLAHNVLYADKKKELNIILQEWIDTTEDTFVLPM